MNRSSESKARHTGKANKLLHWIKPRLKSSKTTQKNRSKDTDLGEKQENGISLRRSIRFSFKGLCSSERRQSKEPSKVLAPSRKNAGSFSSLFSVLPQDTQLEILSFIYDDIGSIDNFLECQEVQFRSSDLKRHMSVCILSSARNLYCQRCDSLSCYPYELHDCGHQVCGRCAYSYRQEMKPCGCGTMIYSRPRRLNTALADSRAYWILSPSENSMRFDWNEMPVHCGVDGHFGRYRIPNPVDPLDRLSFTADYDYLQRFDIRDEFTHQLPSDCGRLYIIICPVSNSLNGFISVQAQNNEKPQHFFFRLGFLIYFSPCFQAHENFAPYTVEEFDVADLKHIWSDRQRWLWLRKICKEDIITLEEEDLDVRDDPVTVERPRFESRVIGWEHLALQCTEDYF